MSAPTAVLTYPGEDVSGAPRAEWSENPPPSRAGAPGDVLRHAWARVRNRTVLATTLALLVALATRLPFFFRSDFPLNDGGMFLAMSQDVMQAHFALPSVSSYNAAGIPFAYPPVSFYLVALIATITRLTPLTLVRFLPLLANLGTVAGVAVLARLLVRSWWGALATALLFPLIPRSYEWMIMGGGLTRSVGFLCATLCLCLAVGVFQRPTLGRTALCAVFAALALASHLELGMFAGYSLVLLALAQGWRRPRVLVTCGVLLLAMVALTAPWWVLVLHRDGLEPFYAASLTSHWTTLQDQLTLLQQFMFPERALLSLIGASAVAGATVCLLRGSWLLPVWLLAVFVMNPRSAASEGTVPLALLAGVGIGDALLPGIIHAARQSGRGSPWLLARRISRSLARSRPATLVVSGVALVAALSLLFVYWPGESTDQQALDSLSPSERQAMIWVSANTSATSSFLVLSTTWSWEEDLVGEWFPTLAQRHSVMTPQGDEWLPDEMNARAMCEFTKVRDLEVPTSGINDLDTWASDHEVPFSDVFISQVDRGSLNWSHLIASARNSTNYTFLIDTPTVTVLQRNTPLVPRWADSGPLMVARDCQSLGDQAPDTQAGFQAADGSQADAAWVAQHNAIIGEQPFAATMLRRLGLLAPQG